MSNELDKVFEAAVNDTKAGSAIPHEEPSHVEEISEAPISEPEINDEHREWAKNTLKEYEELKSQPRFDPNEYTKALKEGLAHLAPPKPAPAPKSWEKYANAEDVDVKNFWTAMSEFIDEHTKPHREEIGNIKNSLPEIYAAANPQYAAERTRAIELMQKFAQFGLNEKAALAMAREEIGKAPKTSAPTNIAGLNATPAHAKTPKNKAVSSAGITEEWNPEKAMKDFIKAKKSR